jgi:Chaperone of endosialidase
MQKQFITAIAIIIFTLSFVAEAPAQKGGLAQLPEKVVKEIYLHGKKICTKKESKKTMNVKNQCEVGINCETGEELTPMPLEELLQAEYVRITVPGQECATFDIDIKHKDNPCRCSGGRCYCWSDRRLKKNIQKIGQLKNGLSVYTFNYIWDSALTVGVMADEVKKVKPKAVININGFDLVDYSEILK